MLLLLVLLSAVFNDEIYILSLIYQSEWRAIATIAAQSRMLICEADFYFHFFVGFLNFDLFHFGIKNRLSNAKQTVDRAATNAIYILYTSQPISGSSPWMLSD